MADGIWVANWQRSAGAKKSNYPQPIPRPGSASTASTSSEFETGTTQLGKGRLRSPAEIDELFTQRARGGDA